MHYLDNAALPWWTHSWQNSAMTRCWNCSAIPHPSISPEWAERAMNHARAQVAATLGVTAGRSILPPAAQRATTLRFKVRRNGPKLGKQYCSDRI